MYEPQRLARFLDRPLFPWKRLIIGFSVAQYLFEGFLSLRQYGVLGKTKPPKVLEQEVSRLERRIAELEAANAAPMVLHDPYAPYRQSCTPPMDDGASALAPEDFQQL